jgi:hypothetical protein
MIINKETLEKCLNDYIKRKGYVVESFDILPDYNEGEGGILVTYRSRIIIDDLPSQYPSLEIYWSGKSKIIVIPLEFYLPYHRDQNLDDLLDVE